MAVYDPLAFISQTLFLLSIDHMVKIADKKFSKKFCGVLDKEFD